MKSLYPVIDTVKKEIFIGKFVVGIKRKKKRTQRKLHVSIPTCCMDIGGGGIVGGGGVIPELANLSLLSS